MLLLLALLTASGSPAVPGPNRGSIRVEVVSADGKPLAGIELEARGIFPNPRHSATDSDGIAVFDDLHPGTWTLSFANRCQSRIGNETAVRTAFGAESREVMVLWANPDSACSSPGVVIDDESPPDASDADLGDAVY